MTDQYAFPDSWLPPEFDVTVDAVGCRITLVGELDIATVSILRREVPALQEQPTSIWTVDLVGLAFIDAAGINALIEMRGAGRGPRAGLSVLNASARTRRAFTAAGAADLLG